MRQKFPALFLIALLGAFGLTSSATAQLSKANQIFISRGLQLQGLVQWDDFFHLDTYSNAYYNSVNWGWQSSPSLLGPAPGVAWSRWVSGDTNMPPQSGEGPYLSNLIALQLGDEWFISDGPTRTNLINWFNSVRSNWPNTILFHNNYAGQADDNALADLIAKAHPDMLSFDMYPFLSVWDASASNHIGATIGGPFTSWYGELRRYRQWGINAQIPFAAYMQTFHSVEDYDQRVYRYPSPSELRLNTFAALAFNAKFLTGFTYNSGAAVLFDILPNGYSGDTYPNTNYTEQIDINRRAKNLGKALVCLQPGYDLHNPNDSPAPPGPASGNPSFPDGYTTSMMLVRGHYMSGGVTNFSDVPNSFLADPDVATANPANPVSLAYTWWEADKNDLYLRGWVVTNKAGIKNSGLPGDVFICWFRSLDESFDGPNYTNEVYFMVVNALTDTTGTAADCMQEIKLNFLNTFSSIVMLDAETGQLQTNTLPIVSTRRQLVLDINGGDAVLFKIADGAPFVGFVPPSRPQLTFQMGTNTPTITIQGTIGAHYEIQSSPVVQNPTWTALTNFMLPSSPFQFTDATASTTGTRFYRAVGIP